MLTNLPSTPEAILKMEWDDYEPHFKIIAINPTDV